MSDAPKRKMIKTSVILPEESVETLKEIAARTGSSAAEILRRAIDTERLLRQTVDEGGKILIQDKDKSLKQLLIR